MSVARVLLTDDEESFVETMTKRLTKRGVEVTPAHCGQEALDALAKNPTIDVVILDVKMPGMDGLQVLREIRVRHPLVEVIMLTGHATVESAIEGMKQGAFDYLMKPCDIDVLLKKVQDAAALKWQHDQKILEARINDITKLRG